jgi:hypothetical protein
MHGEMRNAYKILVGKHEGKSLVGKPRCKLDSNFITIRDCEGVHWIHLVQAGYIPVEEFRDESNGPTGYITRAEFPDQLSGYQLLKKDIASRS